MPRTPRKKRRAPAFLREAGAALREVIYPEGALCQGCGKLSDGRCLCPSCREELRHAGLLYAWERRDLGGVDAWSMRGHTDLARRLVIRLKHGANACIAEELAEIVLPLPSALRLSPDTVVTWVPMPENRKRERCVDHAALLADAIARKLRLLCRPLLLRRETGAHTQRGLGRALRLRNLENAYAPARRIASPVLLIDDVLTTGTTARRCVEALKAGGARQITVLTITHSVR